jgi:hypothetical protein
VSQRRDLTPWELVRVGVAVLFFAAAPTAGDIGSCGQAPDDLDATKFFLSLQAIDCSKCGECELSTAACQRACAADPVPTAFPEGCYPLVHDGEVCLNALWATGCDDYATYVADDAPTTPTECNFCPPEDR